MTEFMGSNELLTIKTSHPFHVSTTHYKYLNDKGNAMLSSVLEKVRESKFDKIISNWTVSIDMVLTWKNGKDAIIFSSKCWAYCVSGNIYRLK